MLFPKPPKMPHELTEGEKDSLIIDIAKGVLSKARTYGSPDAPPPQMARELYAIDGNRREELIAFVNRYKRDWLVNSHHRADFVCVFGQAL